MSEIRMPTADDPAVLVCGDCRDYLPGLVGKVAAVITDPPYGIDYQSGYATDRLWTGGRAITNDQDTGFRDQMLAMLPDVPTLVFGSWRVPRPTKTRQVLVWDKGGALGMGALDIPWKPDHEEIYVIGRGWAGTRDCGSVIRHPPVQSMAKNGRVHPNEKPVGLIRELLRKLPPGGVVLDPCMGSGSVGVACLQMGFRFVGIESDASYYATARRRLDDALGVGGLFESVAPAQPDLFAGG
jgi:hypothetical protein